MSKQLTPHFEEVQHHYDLSDDFYRLFLDPTQTYSCAYFRNEGMTLEEAQIAKIDLALGKLDLRPGMTLLDIGCGWGATLRRAVEKYDVNVVGLTLSKNQAAHTQQVLDEVDTTRSRRILLEGWERFEQPVDRIVSIGAFEHFGSDRYTDFFRKAFELLSDDGIMLLHTIVRTTLQERRRKNIPLTPEVVHFSRFILAEIFPGGWLPTIPVVEEHGEHAGFTVTRVQSLQPHYAKTLDMWAASLKANRDKAIEIQSQEVYDRYMKYLTGCADLFRQGYTDVCQFTMEKPGR
ncbi:cyclopropane mycolic acid synthase family methyltransferase [Mycobacterium sp. 1274761.0]|uniref:cyclopropane mycolic acid synthase family methyltransferase n=1 Tax=Mycobacterium sp. 1274761.0 TaxID=1834077 RepID=UPI00080050AF|nr:cyclopropane mycolic acid synthase family methyltransferase [Mycobacterium sp. 1274761.0]OBK70948.1 SAM-dependent methyltransferase [Mycobacterium sp. 1274761.0]